MTNNRISSSEFLIPQRLRVSQIDFKKVLICGSCMAHALVHFLRLNRPSVEFSHIFLNNLIELPDDPPEPATAYDFQVIALPLRDIVSDQVVSFSGFSDRQQAALIRERAIQALRLMLESSMKFNVRHGMTTFVLGFPAPVVPVASCLSAMGTELDFAVLVRDLNRELATLVSEYKNAMLIDVDAIYSAVGKQHLSEEIFGFYSHGTFFWDEHWMHDRSEGYNAPQPGRIDDVPRLSDHYGVEISGMISALWAHFDAGYRVVNQIDTVKLVIFDLDDTLWRGQIAEHYGEGGSWPVPHGWPLGIWEAVQHLRARGILVAIASKNERSIVEQRWSRAVTEQWLSLSDFVFSEINWDPKAENIRRIIETAALTPKSVVFVDDNPVERESVRAALPGIRVIGENPFETKRILLWSAETQRVSLTNESLSREEMMRKQVVRERDRSSMSREEFLAALDCRVSINRIIDATDSRLVRAVELLNKTNQFNTTGRRWKSGEIDGFLGDGGTIYSFEVEDKYTAYGLVGVILYKDGHFEQFAMSCRVLGLSIEHSVLSKIIELEATKGQAAFSAHVVETDANIVSRSVFEKIGMTGAFPRQILPGLDSLPAPAAHLQMAVI